MHLAAVDISDTVSILIWSGVLIVVVLVLFFIVNALRKSLWGDNAGEADTPFTLDDLRRLHREGRITDDEYEKARAQIIAMVQGPPPAPPPEVEAGEGARDGEATDEETGDSPDDVADPPDEGDYDGKTDRDGS